MPVKRNNVDYIKMLRDFILTLLAWLYMNFVYYTSRVKYVNKEPVDEIKSSEKNVIYAFLHGRQSLLVPTHRTQSIVIMTSLSRDGDLQTRIMQSSGYIIVRGSTPRGARKALRQIIEVGNTHDIAFAVDGPKGPVNEVKPGVVFASKILKRKIIPVTTSVKHKRFFEKAWDKYMLPLPFNTGVVVYGKPIIINEKDDLKSKIYEVQQELLKITSEADSMV